MQHNRIINFMPVWTTNLALASTNPHPNLKRKFTHFHNQINTSKVSWNQNPTHSKSKLTWSTGNGRRGRTRDDAWDWNRRRRRTELSLDGEVRIDAREVWWLAIFKEVIKGKFNVGGLAITLIIMTLAPIIFAGFFALFGGECKSQLMERWGSSLLQFNTFKNGKKELQLGPRAVLIFYI